MAITRVRYVEAISIVGSPFGCDDARPSGSFAEHSSTFYHASPGSISVSRFMGTNEMKLWSCVLMGSLSLTAIGCNSAYDDAPTAPPVPVASAAKDASASTAVKSSDGVAGGARSFEYSQDITFDIPATWREDPNPNMVDSRYFISTSEGELQLTLTSMGGGLNQNIERWVDQVKTGGEEPTRDEVRIAGVDCPRVDARGDYNNNVGIDKGQKSNWRLIGIGVPNKGRDFFVKLVGPRDAVKEFQEELDAFLATARFGG